MLDFVTVCNKYNFVCNSSTMQHNKEYKKLTSFFMRERILPYGVKIQIFIYGFLLIVFNSMLAYQKNNAFYVFALIGVLPSFIKTKTKIRAFICALLSFLVFYSQNTILFYILYGYVLSSTYQATSSICLCLQKESFDFLRKLEIICLILPYLIDINRTVLLSLLVINVALIYKGQTPPHEYERSNSLTKIHKYIKDTIMVDDYCLIAEEHRLIIKKELRAYNTTFDPPMFVDMIYPLIVLNIIILCKISMYVFSAFTHTKYFAPFVFFYVFIIFEMPIISMLLTPFCTNSYRCDFTTSRISLLMFSRVLTGYALAKILYLFV